MISIKMMRLPPLRRFFLPVAGTMGIAGSDPNIVPKRSFSLKEYGKNNRLLSNWCPKF